MNLRLFSQTLQFELSSPLTIRHKKVFTGKHLYRSLHLINLLAFKHATLLKRDSNTGDLRWLRKEHLFWRTPFLKCLNYLEHQSCCSCKWIWELILPWIIFLTRDLVQGSLGFVLADLSTGNPDLWIQMLLAGIYLSKVNNGSTRVIYVLSFWCLLSHFRSTIWNE